MDAMTVTIIAQVAGQMVTYEAQIHTLEGSKHVGSEPKVTNERALHDVQSPTRIIVRSFIDSTQGNNILFLFIIY